MAERVHNVLFLCTHNSARSVMAEALLNVLGQGRFRAFSAGSAPSGRVNPFAIEQCAQLGYDATQVRSKSWDEFAVTGAPQMDIIITVCDNAAGESCPFWPGHPATAHWGFPDPSSTVGDDSVKRAAFAQCVRDIRVRIEKLVALPIATLSSTALADHLYRIHQP